MSVIITEPKEWITEEFLVRTQKGYDWMEVVVAVKGGFIKLKINSSFGAMGYSWPYQGLSVDWRTWLLDTDFSYFMGKMFGTDYRQFSYEKTLACMKESVMENFDFSELDEKMAKHEVMDWMQDNMGADWWELICQEDRPELVAFWTKVWRPFIEGVQDV